MNLTDTVKLVALMSQLWPSMKLDSHTPDAWHLVLDDVDYDDAVQAIRFLAKSSNRYLMPADIRREIAARYGLLPPAEAEALAAAVHVAGNRGEGASKLHPVTYEAYRAMGGPTAFDAPPSVIRPQWARVWAECVAQHERRTLGGELGEQVAFKKRMALTAVPDGAA